MRVGPRACSLVTLSDLRTRLGTLPFFDQTRTQAARLGAGARLRLKGTVGSLQAFVLAALLSKASEPQN